MAEAKSHKMGSSASNLSDDNDSVKKTIGPKPLGMHMKAIEKFLNDNIGTKDKESEEWIKWTTSDFNREIVKPKTKGTNAAFIDLYKNEQVDGTPLIAPATVFISHAWKYEFVEVVVDVMRQHAELNPDAYFWFDLFTNDQNANNDKDANWYSTTFRQSIESIGKVLLILSPWNDPKPIGRAWCLFEIAHSLRATDVDLRISLPQKETEQMRISAGEKGNIVLENLSKLKAENATATVEQDKDMIFQTIRGFEGGFETLDEKITNKLRDWYKNKLVELSRQRPHDTKLLMTVADVLKDLDEVDKALDHGKRCLDLIGRKAPPKEDAFQMLPACDDLGGVSNKAETNEEVNPVSKSKFWEDTMLTVAITYERTGNSDEALKLYGELLDFLKLTRKEDDFDIAKIYNNTAGIYRNRGELEKTIKCHEDALRIKIASRGEEAITVGISYLNMGNVFLDQMKLDEALDSYELAMNIFTKQQGVNHPRVGKSLANMGEVYYLLGNWTRCLDVQEQALTIKRTSIGKIHVETALTYNCMGRANRELGRLEEAMKCHKEALAIQKEVSSVSFTDIARTHRFIGEVYMMDAKKYKEAQKEYKTSLYQHMEALGENPESMEVALLYVSMGDVHFKQKNLTESLENYKKAIVIQEKQLGNEHPHTGMTYDKLAEVAMETKGLNEKERGEKLTEALEFATKGKEIKLKRLHEYHPSVILSYKLITGINQMQKKTEVATKQLEMIKGLEQTAAEHAELEEALKHLRNAVHIKEQRLGENNPTVIQSYYTMADLYQSLGRTKRAEKLRQDMKKRAESKPTTQTEKDVKTG